MSSRPGAEKGERRRVYSESVGDQEARKLRAMSVNSGSALSGLAVCGLVGWSVVIPTLLGAFAGQWIDQRYPGQHSWTLMLLLAGLFLGCWNAWTWVSRHSGTSLPQAGPESSKP